MLSAAFNHLMNSNEFQLMSIASGKDTVFYYFDIVFHRLTISISNDGLLFKPLALKYQFDSYAGTKSKPSVAKKWFVRRWGRTVELYHKEFKMINDELWAPMRMFDMIVSSFLPKFDAAVSLWLDGKEDWLYHFYEFTYIRCDPKFKQEDWIIKVGRETDPDGRNAQYQAHGRGGPDTVFVLYYVKQGSPAEDDLKELCHERFHQPKKAPVSKEKLGKERFHIPHIHTLDEFYNAVFDLDEAFLNKHEEGIIDTWAWSFRLSKEENLESMNAFIDKYSPKVFENFN